MFFAARPEMSKSYSYNTIRLGYLDLSCESARNVVAHWGRIFTVGNRYQPSRGSGDASQTVDCTEKDLFDYGLLGDLETRRSFRRLRAMPEVGEILSCPKRIKM